MSLDDLATAIELEGGLIPVLIHGVPEIEDTRLSGKIESLVGEIVELVEQCLQLEYAFLHELAAVGIEVGEA